MKRLFELVIGISDEGMYFVAMSSKTDGTQASFQGKTLKVVMAHARKLVESKGRTLKNFPLPTDNPQFTGKIVYPGNGAPKIIVPPGFAQKT